MTDLQLGLLVIGALAVAGVVLYNRVQERATRREAQRAFASSHADVLLGAEPGRREPALHTEPPQPAPLAMPDPRVDYIVELALARPVAAAAILELWAPFEHRFGRRAFLAASDGRGWRRLKAGDGAPCAALQAALQLVTRAGAASDAEVLEFRSDVETVAARLKAAIRAPEMREAVEAAQALDQACAEADIQVALHVLGEFGLDDVAQYAEAPFLVAAREGGVTLTLDVPRTLDTRRAYEAMVRAARHLAAAGGRVVDDNGRELDDAALSAIGRQLEPALRLLAERGLEPGGELALRVFA
ncbi:MAG TPA: cell division protein ZipA C-terminal FtsZ-binding domain-containing protein [Burkholderiales bacterium]|nr:cell division protein ZipA C-terminal FtsZ-binding domain-containing protein [Burkholderiales bacterium]